MIDFSKDYKEIAKDFMRIVNSISFRPQELSEELRNSKEMKQLALHWLVILSSNNYMTDKRNEIAKRRGQEVSRGSIHQEEVRKP